MEAEIYDPDERIFSSSDGREAEAPDDAADLELPFRLRLARRIMREAEPSARQLRALEFIAIGALSVRDGKTGYRRLRPESEQRAFFEATMKTQPLRKADKHEASYVELMEEALRCRSMEELHARGILASLRRIKYDLGREWFHPVLLKAAVQSHLLLERLMAQPGFCEKGSYPPEWGPRGLRPEKRINPDLTEAWRALSSDRNDGVERGREGASSEEGALGMATVSANEGKPETSVAREPSRLERLDSVADGTLRSRLAPAQLRRPRPAPSSSGGARRPSLTEVAAKASGHPMRAGMERKSRGGKRARSAAAGSRRAPGRRVQASLRPMSPRVRTIMWGALALNLVISLRLGLDLMLAPRIAVSASPAIFQVYRPPAGVPRGLFLSARRWKNLLLIKTGDAWFQLKEAERLGLATHLYQHLRGRDHIGEVWIVDLRGLPLAIGRKGTMEILSGRR